MTIEAGKFDHRTLPMDGIDFEVVADWYETELLERTKGPQLEGLTRDQLCIALQDSDTKLIDLGGGIVWPVLIPVTHNPEYRKRFFEDRFGERPAYYLSLPPDGLQGDTNVVKQVHRLLAEVATENGLIAYDYYLPPANEENEENDPIGSLWFANSGLDYVDETPDSDYGRPEVVHFEAVARRTGGESLNISPDGAFAPLTKEGDDYSTWTGTGPIVLSGDILDRNPELIDDIWKMYDGQFNELVKDHPSSQQQPRKDLEAMLLDEDSFNVAYIEEGSIKALCYFVTNLEKCTWLNKRFYDSIRDDTPGVKLAVFPGIVADKDSAGQRLGYVNDMLRLIEQLYVESGSEGVQIVFQCTNVSKTYIPNIVTHVISRHEVFKFDNPANKEGGSFRETGRYKYRVVSPQHSAQA